MRNIYLFNPENDLAIAHGKKRYDAPKAARRLAADMALLPLWYAKENSESCVLTQTEIPADFQKEVLDRLSVKAKWVSQEAYRFQSGDVFRPWGWSPALLERLEPLSEGNLSSPDLSVYRRLSGRQFAVFVLEQLRVRGVLDASVKIPVVAESLQELSSAVASFGSACLLKSPWSGSGKGLLWLRDGWSEKAALWSNHVLKRQGSVVCEPQYAKVQDFAMEFCVEQSQLSFVGYSYFQTDESGTYRGNLLASDERIEQKLSAWLPNPLLQTMRTALLAILSEYLAPFYEGYFGIDMMVCEADGRYFLHPCVELNLRYNMGVVSHILFDRYVASTVEGEYTILHGRNSDELRAFCARMQAEHPLQIEEGRVTSGFLPLTYIGEGSEFLAYMVVL